MAQDVKPYTGRVLVDAYRDAIGAAQQGDPDAPLAIDGFARDLDRIAMRTDRYGEAARRARSMIADEMSRAVGEQPAPRSPAVSVLGRGFGNDDSALDTLGGYLVDDGEYESTRRHDLLGIDRRPSYMGEDGRAYVDAAGVPVELPIEKYRALKPQLVEAFRTEMGPLGAALGPQGAPALAKAGDMAGRAIQMLASGYSWDEVPPLVDVPTADPNAPFAQMPQVGADVFESFALLQDPVELRAMQEVLAEAGQAGELDLSAFDHFIRTAGFLVDFATVGKALGGAGKLAGAGARATLGPVGRLAGMTAKAAEGTTGVQASGAATRPAIRTGFKTVREFAGYHVVQDALYGRIESPQDLVASGMAGAKEGALMVGATLAFSTARTGLTRSLAARTLDPKTGVLRRRFGVLGDLVGSVYDNARLTQTTDQIAAQMAKLSSGGRGLRETLVRAGWTPIAAQTTEHMIDSAGVGLLFGAYHDAIEDPAYEKMGSVERWGRMVQGLTSPAAVGGAAAFAGSSLAHTLAHGVQWGREWEGAPPQVRAEFDQRVATIVRELAQPSNHELTKSFHEAFDAYRAANPKDFEGVKKREPWMQELEQATREAMQEGTAEPLSPEGPPQPTMGNQPPPEGPAGPGASGTPAPLEPAPGGAPAAPRPEVDVSKPFWPGAPRAPVEPQAAPAAPVSRTPKGPSKPRQTAGQRQQDVRARALEGEFGIQGWVRAFGGISIERSRKEGLGGEAEGMRGNRSRGGPFGLGPLVHGAKSKKGMSIDALLEHAIEAGYLPDGAGVRELLDAISANAGLQNEEWRVHESQRQAEDAARWWALSQEERAAVEARLREDAELDAQAEREGFDPVQGRREDPGFTLFAAAPGFIDFPEKPTGEMPAKASADWMRTIQDTLFPLTEFRTERARGLAKAVVNVFGLPVEHAEAAVQLMEAHAEVWSKSHGKKPEDWYKERLAGLTKNPPPLGAPQGARAATTFLADGRAVLHALEQPTIADVLHELGHVWRRDLQGKHQSSVERWAGVHNGAWTVKAEEKFAGAVERYARTGKAPTAELQGAFGQLKSWMRALYQRIRGTGLDVKMDAPVRRALDSLFELGKLDEDMVLRERMAKLDEQAKADIYKKNRNRPQYVGLSLDEIVGHELRGGLPEVELSKSVRVAQAGDSVREAVEILRLHGVIDQAVPYESPEAAHAMIELARGGDAYKGQFEAKGSTAAFTQAVDAAKRAKVQMRELARASVPETSKPRLEHLFEYVDKLQGKEPIEPEFLDRMKKSGLVDEHGLFDRQAAAALGAQIEVELAKAALDGAADKRLHEPSAAARPWIALNHSPWEFKEHALARAMKLERVVDWATKRGAIPPEMLRALQRVGLVFGGMWKANFNGRRVNDTIQSGVMHVFGPNERATRLLQGRADDALARWLSRVGGRVPPRSHTKLLNWALETGEIRRMRGPHDFEKLRQGTGYLFELGREISDILSQLGQHSVYRSFLDPKQFEKWNGRYVPHLYLGDLEKEAVAELREGRLPAFAGRNLGRSGGTETQERLRIEDPFQWLTAVTRQEGAAVQYLGVLADLVYGHHAITKQELAKLDPYTQVSYESFGLNPASNPAGLGNGPGLRNWYVAGDMLAKQLAPGHPAPKSKEFQAVLERLLGVDANGQPTKDGGMYLPRQLLWELDGLTAQVFNPPELDTLLGRAAKLYDDATRHYRRGLTIGRPKHWTLNILNAIGTNHSLDRLPAWDVARSVFSGKGYYAEAVKQLVDLVRLSETGDIDTKPPEWTNERWERVQLLKRGFVELNGTTFTGVGLEASVVADALSSIITPDMKTASLLADIEARGGLPESAAYWRASVFDMSRRWSGGMAEFDRRVNRMLGSHDAAERARGVANFTALYQVWEMTFKWAATMRTLDTQPVGISLQQAVRHAAAGTADYANTSPLMRSFNTTNNTFGNPLFAKTEGGGKWARAVLREVLKGRFWMYAITMTPALMAAPIAHPMRNLTILGLSAGVTAALMGLAQQDPDEQRSFDEALSGSIARSGSPVLDEAALEIAQRANPGVPDVTGSGVMTDDARKARSSLWWKMLRGAGLMFEAPSRGDQTRISSLEDLTPGWGNWIGAAHGAQNFMQGSKADAATAILDQLSLRAGELTLSLGRGLFGAAKLAASDDSGDSIVKAMKGIREAAADVIPTISPLWPVSRDGQRWLEVSAINGQSFDEYARGVVQVDRPSPMQAGGEALFGMLWRTERLLQPQLGGVSEKEALDAIWGRLMPEDPPMSRGPSADRRRQGQSDVHFQISEVLAGTYQEYLGWGRSTMTFDAMLAHAMFQRDGPMQQFLAQETDPDQQGRKRRYFERFVAGDEWNRAADSMMEIARRREMQPDYFRQAVTNAMRDPTGVALFNWIDSRLSRGKPDPQELPDLAAAFMRGVKEPAFGTEQHHEWSRVLKRFYQYGFSEPYLPDNAADAMRRLGLKPELAGLPALQEATRTR